MPSQTVRLSGHIVDSLTLSKVLDTILREGGQHKVSHFDIGTTRSDKSCAEIDIEAKDEETLAHILEQLKPYGALRIEKNTAEGS